MKQDEAIHKNVDGGLRMGMGEDLKSEFPFSEFRRKIEHVC